LLFRHHRLVNIPCRLRVAGDLSCGQGGLSGGCRGFNLSQALLRDVIRMFGDRPVRQIVEIPLALFNKMPGSFGHRSGLPRARVTRHLTFSVRVSRLLSHRRLFRVWHARLPCVLATLVLLAFRIVFIGHEWALLASSINGPDQAFVPPVAWTTAPR
jgi:hypothetical protein